MGPEETTCRLRSGWCPEQARHEGVDYQLEDLTAVWVRTNLQDRALAENNQRGINGFGYAGTLCTGRRGARDPLQQLVSRHRAGRGRVPDRLTSMASYPVALHQEELARKGYTILPDVLRHRGRRTA